MTTKTNWLDVCNIALRRMNVTPIALSDLSPTSPIGVGTIPGGVTLKAQATAMEYNLPFAIDEVTRKFRWPDLISRARLIRYTKTANITWTAGSFGSYTFYYQLPSDFDISGTYSVAPAIGYYLQTITTLNQPDTYRIWYTSNPGGEVLTYTPLNYSQKSYSYVMPSDFLDALDSYPNQDDHTFVELLNPKYYITSASYTIEGAIMYTDDPAPILLYLRRPNPLAASGETLRDTMWYLYSLRLGAMTAPMLTASGSPATTELNAEYAAKVLEHGRIDAQRGAKPADKIIWGQHSRRGFRQN